MRPASCRWLRPLRSRMARMEAARFKCPRCAAGISCGAGACTISGSSSSKDKWHRRQRLLDVRNWTKRQRSHRTTSRESTGAKVVAIDRWELPERARPQEPNACSSNLLGNLRYHACGSQVNSRTKYGIARTKPGKNRRKPRETRCENRIDRNKEQRLLSGFRSGCSISKSSQNKWPLESSLQGGRGRGGFLASV